MSKQLSKTEQHELHALARRISEREDVIAQLKKNWLDDTSAILREAIFQGHDLIKAKATVPHGLFLEWLKVNCPRVQNTQAHIYMRIAANLQRGVNLSEADSVRSALLLCERAEIERGDKQAKEWVPYLEGLSRFGKAVKFLRDEPINAWPIEGQDQLRADLEPVCKVLWPERFGA